MPVRLPLLLHYAILIKSNLYDGDGALIMHAGSLAVSADCDNLIHIVINNAAHDSVGGQPTKGEKLNLANIAKSFGYKTTYFVDSLVDLEKIMQMHFLRGKCIHRGQMF